MPPTGIVLSCSMLLAEATASRVAAELRRSAIEVLLIKGSSTERWLYHRDEARTSIDIDLLVAPDKIVAAERALGRLGYVSRFDGPAPAWTDQHAHLWISDSFRTPIDLHRALFGCTADARTVFAEVWSGREQLELAGGVVEVPRVGARAMMLAIHAFQHGADNERAQEDLRRALVRETLDTWRDAARIAGVCGAQEGFAGGLSLGAEGRRALKDLGLGPPRVACRPTAAEVTHLMPADEGVLRIRRASGGRDRLSIIWREVFPSSRFMRVRSPQADLAVRGRLGLVAAYPTRWWSVGRSMVRGKLARRRSA